MLVFVKGPVLLIVSSMSHGTRLFLLRGGNAEGLYKVRHFRVFSVFEKLCLGSYTVCTCIYKLFLDPTTCEKKNLKKYVIPIEHINFCLFVIISGTIQCDAYSQGTWVLLSIIRNLEAILNCGSNVYVTHKCCPVLCGASIPGLGISGRGLGPNPLQTPREAALSHSRSQDLSLLCLNQ